MNCKRDGRPGLVLARLAGGLAMFIERSGAVTGRRWGPERRPLSLRAAATVCALQLALQTCGSRRRSGLPYSARPGQREFCCRMTSQKHLKMLSTIPAMLIWALVTSPQVMTNRMRKLFCRGAIHLLITKP